VAIGYGVVRKSDLTGAVTSVSSDEISSSPVARLDQALQGKAAGVQVTSISGEPGTGTTIRIRGGNSISADNEPLYVIDGFIGGGDLNSINPNDIESIEILKDATATAIYGARGANGVILVTTKRGKEGASRININSYYGVQTLANEIDFLKGPDRAAYAKESEEHLNQKVTFPDPSSVSHTDWLKVLTHNAPVTNTDISFSGGTKSLKYYLSGNYFKQDGIVLNSGLERYQSRLNLDANLNSWLSVGTTMNISRTLNSNNKVNFRTVYLNHNPTSPVYNEDGTYNIINTLFGGATFDNQLAYAEMVTDNTYNTRFLGNYYLAANLKNGLTLKSTLGVDLNYSKTNNYEPGELPIRKSQDIGGYARVSTSTPTEILNENTIAYIKDFENHSINLLGGATYQHSQSESLWASGDGFTNDVLEYNKLSTGNPALRNSDTGYSDWTIISFIGRANYSYKNKYLFTIAGRYDGSSRLAANHKWAFFPSAAIAWRLMEEDFIKDTGIFSNLKLRASYGKSGNQAIGVYSTLPSLDVNKVFFNSTEWVAYQTGNIPNPDLKWETTDQYDVGLEGGFFNGKLSFEFDYYYKRTHDLLLTVEIPNQTGYPSRLVNIGEVENKGAELLINARPVTTKNFSWELSFNISANRNKVLNLGGKDFVDVARGSRLIVGEPAIVFYGLAYDGTWHTQEEIDASNGFMPGVKPGYPKFKDVDGSGKFEKTSDREILGSPEPDFFGGIQNTLKYKNFEIDFYFQGTYGNKIYNEFGARYFYGNPDGNLSTMALNRWTEENYLSDIPRAGSHNSVNYNQDVHSTDVQDGSFLRLKTLRFAYNIPYNLNWLNRAQFYFIANNIFCLNKYDWGYDPEVNSYGTHSIVRGYDDGYTYPASRSFSVGLNVEF
jgi:TonB-dependent starch-binding outer membrane protein SusC